MTVYKWKQASGVVRGRDHVEDGKVCQDNVAYIRRNRVQVLALSDGAGSRKASEVGSKAVTNRVCDILSHRFDELYIMLEKTDDTSPRLEEVKQIIMDGVLDAVKAEVTDDRALSDMAATMLFVALKGDRYIMGHMGDGVIGALVENGEQSLTVLSAPDNGDAPNITFFVTEKDAVQHFRLQSGEMKNLRALILMSDGVEDALYKDNRLHANTLKLFGNFKGISEADYSTVIQSFLSQYVAKYSDDDLSINMIYLEDTDTSVASGEYVDYLLSDIVSEEQVVKVSSYSVLLDNTYVPCAQSDRASIRKRVL